MTLRVRSRHALRIFAIAAAFAAGGCGSDDQSAQQRVPSSTAAPSDVAGVAETKALLDGVPQDGLVLGDKSAPVTIVEIVDLQCPFCRQHQLEVQPKVIKRLVRTGRVQLHLVPIGFLGADSQRMEIVLLRLGAHDKAWDFANLVFWNQGREGSGYATDGWLRSIVSAIPGTNASQASSLASTTPDEQITQTAQAASAIAQVTLRRIGGGGTPLFSVGRTGTAAQDLTPVLSGSPPDAYERLLKAVKAVEAGEEPEAYTIPRGRQQDGTPLTPKGA